MEFWLEVFLRAVFRMERVFRKSLKRAIPFLDELWERPAAVLASQEVRIGPSRRYVIGTLMGLLFGQVFCCVLVLSLPEDHRPRPLPVGDVALRIFLFIAPVVLVSVLFIYLLRGGELIMTPEGVSFRLRRSAVFAPWWAFAAVREIDSSGPLAVFVPVPPAAIEQLRQELDGDFVALGNAVNTKQVRPSKKRVGLIIRDLYAVRIDQIVPLLAEIARELARPGRPIAGGESKRV